MKWIKHFKILAIFAAHILTAVAVFCVIGIGALAIHFVRLKLQAQGLDDVVILGLHGIEILLFGCDIIATGFWAIMSSMKAIKEMAE